MSHILQQCFYIYFIESSFPRKLVETADICYASVWHARNIIGEETAFHTLFQAPSHYTHSICWWVLHALLSTFYLWDLAKSFSLCSCMAHNLSFISPMIAAFRMFIAMLNPFFGSLLGFLGGLVFAPTTYFVRNKFFLIHLSEIIKALQHKISIQYLDIIFRNRVPLIFNLGFLQLPCMMWLAIYKPKRFSLSWFANWVC